MNNLIQQIIDRRMIGMGLPNYQLDIMTIEFTEAETQLFFAQNEYWFLLDLSDSTDDLILVGDNNIVSTSDDLHAGSILINPVDFTGNIAIEKAVHTTDQVLTFVRATTLL